MRSQPKARPGHVAPSARQPLAYERIASDWLRLLRGTRSQTAFSRRLGYRSNIAYRWEAGRCWPTAPEVFTIIQHLGGDVRGALHKFYAKAPPWLLSHDPHTRDGVAALLDDLRGKTTIHDLAARAGKSRFAVGRWMSGEAVPRLPEFLCLVQASSLRMLDFCAAFFDPELLPSLREAWRQLQRARALAYEAPWSQAVLRALELEGYARLPRHDPRWLGAKLGISEADVVTCIDALEAAGQVARDEGRYRVTTASALDTRSEPERARALRQHWLEVADQRLRLGAPGVFAYNLFSVSQRDLERLQQLHREYFREMRRIIAESSPDERVVLFNTQLFALDGEGVDA